MIKNNSHMKGCVYTIYDCSQALMSEFMQDNVSPEYCEEKIKKIELDLKCLKNSLGLLDNL